MLRLCVVFLLFLSMIVSKEIESQKQNDWIKRVNVNLIICEICKTKGNLVIYNRNVLECSNCEYMSLISDYKNQLYKMFQFVEKNKSMV